VLYFQFFKSLGLFSGFVYYKLLKYSAIRSRGTASVFITFCVSIFARKTILYANINTCLKKYIVHADSRGQCHEGFVIKTSYYNNVFINIILSIVFINALLSIKS
jgi:hypothetical protein